MACSKNKTGLVIICHLFFLSKWCKGEKESIGFKPKTQVQPNRAHPLLQGPPHHTLLLPWGRAWECQKSEWCCSFLGSLLTALEATKKALFCIRDEKSNTNLWRVVTNSRFHPLQNAELCFHLAMADVTFPFRPAWDFYTLCQGCDLFITHTDIYVSHTLICCPLVFYPLINPYLFPLCFQCGLFNEQWTKATENNACWSQRKLRKRPIVGATHHVNSDSSLIGWTDVSFSIPKSFFSIGCNCSNCV